MLSTDGARRVLRRAKKAIQIGLLADNFIDVWGSIVAGRKLQELRLRSGVTLRAPESVQLWNHFNDIWLDRVYNCDGFDAPVQGTVVDIGANVGLFSILSAQRAARVFAFEPFGPCFDWLSRNVENNHLSHTIRPFNVAVAGTKGTRTFHVQSELTSNSLYGSGAGTPVTVQCTTLDSIVAEQCEGKCDFLKMDCEGAEFEILLGCQDATLRGIGALAMEVHEGVDGHMAAELERRLVASDFEVRTVRLNGCLIMKAKNKRAQMGQLS